MRSLSFLIVVMLLAGCASGVVQTAPTEPTPPQKPPGLDRSTHWVRNSAEYQAALRQTYSLAGRRLREVVAEKEPGTWAVSVDADETTISNSEYDKELTLAGRRSTLELWDAWVARRAAPPLPGVIEFLELVRELGGYIAIVTNRIEEHCPDTQANFRAFDIPFDVMLCRTDSRSKEPRWEMVEQGVASADLPPLEIVMWVGDNIRDFPGMDQGSRFGSATAFRDFGSRFFVLPNPIHGSWMDNPEN